jgi:hypothetical protein
MTGFKNSTRTIQGHHPWGGGSIGGVDRIDANPGHAEVFPKEGNRMQGNSATLRKEAPTEELAEHGGRTPLTAGFKKGGPAKHFHVHKHFHAKGGRTRSVSHSYSAAEKHAETFAEGGHVHDSTHIPAGGPDYKRGGRTVKKNAGGALYATGGTVNRLAMGGPPMPMGALQAPPQGALGRMGMRPPGLPNRPQLPMRRPLPMPGPSPLTRAKGGSAPMRKVAKQAVAKHVRTAPPRGHGVK